MATDDTTPEQAPAAGKKATTPRKTMPKTETATKVTRKTAAPALANAADPETKPDFAPTLTATGRLGHSTCGHPRTFAGRQACRTAQRAAQA